MAQHTTSRNLNNNPEITDEFEHYDFNLKSVCWGYRDIFRRAITDLFENGSLGGNNRQVTDKFFELLNATDQGCFDHVVKDFLAALNPSNRWLLSLPAIFSDLVNLGMELAQSKLFHGSLYFQTLAEGGFGDNPYQVRNLLNQMRRLRQIDEDLALAYMKGYKNLISRLSGPETERYIQVGLEIYQRNRDAGLAFMEGTLRTAETYIQSISQECRLEDVQEQLKTLLKSLAGYEVDVDDLGKLDSDELIERGSGVVCMYQWLYLPARIRYFGAKELNRKWYLLMTVLAAGFLSEESFCKVHGHPDLQSCRDLVGDNIMRLNLFQIIEYVRVFHRIRQQWPGIRRLVDFGLQKEFEHNPGNGAANKLFFDVLLPPSRDAAGLRTARLIEKIAEKSSNCFDTAKRLEQCDDSVAVQEYAGLEQQLLAPLSLLPDFLYPGEVSTPPATDMVANLKNMAEQSEKEDREKGDEKAENRDNDRQTVMSMTEDEKKDEDEKEEEKSEGSLREGFLYDEWNYHEDDYRLNHCCVYEEMEKQICREVPADIEAEAKKVSKIFEQLKPQLARYEKRLEDGDVIDEDMLVDYLTRQQKEPEPRIDFYRKIRVMERDLAIVLLVDESGSTGEEVNGERIIELEKHAAIILGECLSSLGDKFEIAGFTSNGAQNCRYRLYKNFPETWGREPMMKVMNARPSQSTRIGPAVRHAGYRLAQNQARQRLIILITDGRPMDNDYDPNTRYAQYDVRMACEENTRQGIHTFAISTSENTLADMEIMFPRRRFVILPDISRLPRVLPRLYSRLTL
ncbi:MAG: nitric oxide reductase activation protein NorD [Lentisphaeria bacterium]